MSFNFKVGGAWQQLASGWIKVAGTWQQVQSAWVKVAGVWQQVYENIVWALSGTSGSPTTKVHVALDPAAGNVVWSICGDTTGANGTQKGFIQNDGYDAGDAIAYANEAAFVTPQSGWGVIYVRLTADSGVADASSHAIDGTTWHTLTEDSTIITWTETHDGPIPEECVVKVEFCTVGDGSDIVATGYYKSTVSSEA